MKDGIWQYAGWIILLLLIPLIVKFFKWFIFMQKIRIQNKIRSVKRNIMSSTEAKIFSTIAEVAKESASTPEIRSTGGATATMLERIQKDFKDFHAADAEADIKTFMMEYLDIVSGKKTKFVKAKVSDKVEIDFSNKKYSTLSNEKINQLAISSYQKSLNSATITYRISVGFNTNGQRYENLYEVLYTLQLRNEYDESAFLECKNCGAPIQETDGVCPYCGTKHIRDTIESWVVTGIKEK